MVQYSCFASPLGRILIGWTQDAVVSLRLSDSVSGVTAASSVALQAIRELTEYFEGRRKTFSFPIHMEGTAFQRAVWNELLQIPYGQTRSYGDIAAAIGNPRASRAVGMACNRNPIWIAVPCHRVIGKNRQLTGYEGGIAMKQLLLNLEKANT